jgi:hypothetical protein
LPPVDPDGHRARLTQQLDAIEQRVRARAAGARDQEATREIVAVHPATPAELAADQLDDSRDDTRLIGVDDRGTALLDVADAHLQHLRRKVDGFADNSRVRTRRLKDGSIVVRRHSERAVAPIASIDLAALVDVRGPRLRDAQLDAAVSYWFEVGCRGGYRRPPAETDASRAQIVRQVRRIGWNARVDDFVGPEMVYFYVHLTLAQIEELRGATDCIYEVELAPEPLRDLHLLEDMTTEEARQFVLTPPPGPAPSIVLLDSGIATMHPLLQPALLTATTAGPEIPSPEDTFGHGTKMAGVALYEDLGGSLQTGRANARWWIQSSRLLVAPGLGTAADDNYAKWPVLTLGAITSVEMADPLPRARVFALAVTRSMQVPPLDTLTPTLWSQAIDQLAHNQGRGRLLVVAAGNARDGQWLALAEQHPQLQLSEKIHQPAQAANALTVGAFTARVQLPPSKEYVDARVVATDVGGISPFTSTGLPGNEWAIKPDVVLEGGNLAIQGTLLDAGVPTLTALTTSNKHNVGQPLGQLSMTSEATARAARLAARIWVVEPNLRPETVRGLIVHSANWTEAMLSQFQNANDRLLACGYGVPDEALAVECARDLATVIVEDSMPNAVIEGVPKKRPPKRPTTKPTEPKVRRKAKLYRLPIPEALLGQGDVDVELRVTLSYFAEPNKYGRRTFHGLDLKWDMQGPQETEAQFIERVNAHKRTERSPLVRTKSFDWQIGIQPRGRGTVQSDRWRGRLSALAGNKLIAILPVLGWWEQRRALREQEAGFSLIVTLRAPGIYAAIKPLVEAQTQVVVEVPAV